MEQEKWIEQLHNKLVEHETTAPEGLWEDIEAALLAAKPTNTRRLLTLRRWLAAASVAAVLFGSGYLWWMTAGQSPEQSQRMTAERSPELSQSMTAELSPKLSQPMTAERSPLNSRDVRSTPGTVVEVTAILEGSPIPADKPTVDTEETRLQSTSTTTQMIPTDPSQPMTAERSPLNSRDVRSTPGTVVEETATLNGSPIPTSKAATSTTPTIALYAMNGFGTQNSGNGVQMADAVARQYYNVYEYSNVSAARSAEPIYLTGYEEHLHHRLPVSYGLTLSYPLSERLSLVTGVVYTKLTSDFTQTIRTQQIRQEQTLHFVGVPVGLNYRLWNYKSFKSYISTGVKADWNVATHLETEGVSQHLDKDRLQWSLNGGLGIQYDVLPQLGLYAEPGLNWYPDNGSRLQNYFKDKPLNFSLQVGLRLNLHR